MKFKDNCFTLIRLICAFQVFYGHAFEAFGLPMNHILTSFLSMFRGVPIFFALSGYLIWNSIKKDTRKNEYLRKRFFRLYPELWIVVLFSIISIIPFVKINFIQFIAWIFAQCTLFQFWTPSFLRDYGVGTPNGSLWTITVFAQFYILVYFLKKLYLKNYDKKKVFLIPLIGLVINIVWILLIRNNLPLIADKLFRVTILPYVWIFGIGIVLCEYRETVVPYLTKLFPILMIGLFSLYYFNVFDFDVENYLLFRTVLSILFIFGLGYKFKKIRIEVDISYEFYLVHMVIINLIIAAGKTSKSISILISFLLSIIFSYIIWIINHRICQKYLII